MLSKEICKQCKKSHGLWNNVDELNWEEKRLWCYYNELEMIEISIAHAPKWCPYSLEHLMKSQKHVK